MIDTCLNCLLFDRGSHLWARYLGMVRLHWGSSLLCTLPIPFILTVSPMQDDIASPTLSTPPLNPLKPLKQYGAPCINPTGGHRSTSGSDLGPDAGEENQITRTPLMVSNIDFRTIQNPSSVTDCFIIRFQVAGSLDIRTKGHGA